MCSMGGAIASSRTAIFLLQIQWLFVVISPSTKLLNPWLFSQVIYVQHIQSRCGIPHPQYSDCVHVQQKQWWHSWWYHYIASTFEKTHPCYHDYRLPLPTIELLKVIYYYKEDELGRHMLLPTIAYKKI